MSLLDFTGKTILVFGVANRKSVAWHVACTLEDAGAKVVYSVRSEERRKSLTKQLKDKPVYICDVEEEGAIERLAKEISESHPTIDGILHSIAFANFDEGLKPFHETKRKDYLQATTISSFSLVEIAGAFKSNLANNASVVAISISSLLITAENYGYMSPIKAALDSSARYLAKSFSADTEIRFNTVNSGPLKTSASAYTQG